MLKFSALRASIVISLVVIEQSIFMAGFRQLHPVLILFLGLVVCGSSRAVTFRAPIDQTDWQLEASKFECRLSHAIPQFGTAVFEHRAGESLEFQLRSPQSVLLGDRTRLVAEAPPWRPGDGVRELALLNNGDGRGQLKLTAGNAKDVLTTLYTGSEPAFSNASWHGTDEPVKVAISPANFHSAYDSYMGCVAELLPVNFRQIARSAVLFPSAQWRLSDATKKRLDLIALYAKTDQSVRTIYVDGHSDSQGRRLTNRDLSRKRAEEVTRYLTELGLSEEMITTRYHGERYPVVKNNSKANRDRNRRVTVRLERE